MSRGDGKGLVKTKKAPAAAADLGQHPPLALRLGVAHEREVMNGIMYVLSTGCQWREKGGPVSIRMALMRARRSKARTPSSCRYPGFVAPRHKSARPRGLVLPRATGAIFGCVAELHEPASARGATTISCNAQAALIFVA